MEGPKRRWRFGPSGPEEVAPPPDSPQEAPSSDSARVEREAEAHFTPGPDELEEAPPREEARWSARRPEGLEEAPPASEAVCREDALLPPEESGTNIQ